MSAKDTSRLERLTTILTILQSNRLVTATKLSERFEVSVRTIYRDIRSLEKSGVPILTEEGRGYSLLEGFRLPPVMFTEAEANALITAGKLLSIHPDHSLIRDLNGALERVKAVLRHESKEKTDFLVSRMNVYGNPPELNESGYLADIQKALTDFKVMRLAYEDENKQATQRFVEPFALVNSIKSGWYMIAFCRLRDDFRMFRLDRVVNLIETTEKFTPHKLTLEEFYKKYHAN